MKKIKEILKNYGFVLTVLVFIITLIGYCLIGTEGDVPFIKNAAPKEIKNRGWEIMRYEGYERGSWGNHGGKVWYHVRNVDNHNIQYRVCIIEWKGELHFVYGEPEILQRIEYPPIINQY